MLIYFEPEVAGRVVDGLERALAPHGTLLLGAADRLCSSANRMPRRDHGQVAQRFSSRRAVVPPSLRRPLGHDARDRKPPPPMSSVARLSPALDGALRAADAGDLQAALAGTAVALSADPLDSNAYFIRGLAEGRLGRHPQAIGALRSALYIEPDFALAAFEMGRAHEACGDSPAAVRAYTRALGALGQPTINRPAYRQVDPGDIAAACRSRLRALNQPGDGRDADVTELRTP